MKPDPMAVYEELRKKGGRPLKLKNLAALHELCRDQYDSGSREFSTAQIGKLCEERHIMNGRGLFNQSALDYRTLIDAWSKYAGPSPGKVKKELQGDEFLHRIGDPAIRMLVQKSLLEARKLRSQLETLRKVNSLVVDKRPALPPADLSHMQPGSTLTHAEKDALRSAISPPFLEEQGWRESGLGEIVDERGRTVFNAGFATAVRKVLAQQKQPPTGK